MSDHLRLSRRHLLAGGAALAGVGILAPGLARRARADSHTLRFITPFGYLIGFAPVLNAEAGGHFKAQGLEVEIIGGKSSAMAVQQVLADNAQIGRGAPLSMVKAVGNEGAPMKAVATVLHQSPFYVVSGKANPINGPQDMVGKTIGVVAKGSGTENVLDMMLGVAGIDAEQVQREAVGNSAGAYALIGQGRIDAFIVSVGTVTRLRSSGEDIVAWNTDEAAPAPGQAYFARDAFIESNGDTIVRFLRGVKASMQELLAAAEPIELLDRIAGKYEIIGIKDRDFTRAAMKDEEALWLGKGRTEADLLRNVPEDWQKMVEAMIKVGLAKEGLDPTGLYTNAFVEKI